MQARRSEAREETVSIEERAGLVAEILHDMLDVAASIAWNLHDLSDEIEENEIGWSDAELLDQRMFDKLLVPIIAIDRFLHATRLSFEMRLVRNTYCKLVRTGKRVLLTVDEDRYVFPLDPTLADVALFLLLNPEVRTWTKPYLEPEEVGTIRVLEMVYATLPRNAGFEDVPWNAEGTAGIYLGSRIECVSLKLDEEEEREYRLYVRGRHGCIKYATNHEEGLETLLRVFVTPEDAKLLDWVLKRAKNIKRMYLSYEAFVRVVNERTA